jgi:DNA-binding NarL/FixJ family response regulator
MVAMNRKWRVIIVEDHTMVSDALKAALATQVRLDVAGVAGGVAEARQRLTEIEPDLVLVDLLLGDGDAMELLRFIHEQHPRARTIVLTSLRDAFAANEAFASGAAGFVLKTQPFEDLIQAIELVMSGRRYVSPRMANRLTADGPLPDDQRGLDKLSRREREILQLIVGGLTSAEIGRRLHISVKTIDTHRSNMYRKLGLRNTVDLVRFATLRGLSVGAPGGD